MIRLIFATQSAAVAAALEEMMQDEVEREIALSALGQEIRARIETSRTSFIDQDDAVAAALDVAEHGPPHQNTVPEQRILPIKGCNPCL